MGDQAEQLRDPAGAHAGTRRRHVPPAAVGLMRFVFLDALSLAVGVPRDRAQAVQCQRWAIDLAAAGVRIFVPEIADFEVRGELLRIGAAASLRRLDHVSTLDERLSTAVMVKAAGSCGRRHGRREADCAPDALDGDFRTQGRLSWRPVQGYRDGGNGERRPPAAVRRCGGRESIAANR